MRVKKALVFKAFQKRLSASCPSSLDADSIVRVSTSPMGELSQMVLITLFKQWISHLGVNVLLTLMGSWDP
jgi:hypothetical protein